MRNKGFFWFLTILLLAVSLYQLSFTWYAVKEERKAEKEAVLKVNQLREESFKNEGDQKGIGFLPNNTTVDFNSPEGEALAKAAFINEILRERGSKEVYPIFGSTFSEVKKRSLAFGLDLVGGMSVTMEISTGDLLISHAQSPNSVRFKTIYAEANRKYNAGKGDFLDLFIQAAEKNNTKLSLILKGDGIGVNSTNNEIERYFKDLLKSSMDGVEQIMYRRINQFGVAQPNIQKDLATNRLYIELPGVQDENTVAQKLKSTANLEFFETFAPSQIKNELANADLISKNAESTMSDTTDTADTASNRPAKEEGRLSLGGSSKTKSLMDYIQPVGDYAIGSVLAMDKGAVDQILKREDVMAALPPNIRFMWGAEPNEMDKKSKQTGYMLYACRVPENGKARVNGQHISSASTGFDQRDGKITVDLKMTPEGTDEWGQMTTENKDRIVAITMDNVVYSAPTVINAITSGSTQISGTFTFEEAESLAGLLNGGALPAPCLIKEQNRVGPSIGAENSQAGLVSFGFAFLAVLLYMFFYYGKSGIAANIALLANVVFIMGCLASFGAVLTLAGIAGIILTIGTAVDANILIFERIREEQRAGVETKTAIDIGFKKALPSIIDANISHLLVAVVLKYFGTGEIESFATTLIVGIFTSVFSAIFISRLVINFWMERNKGVAFDTKYSKGLFQNFHFNWIGARKYFYIFSISVTVIGMISLFTRGLKQSVEFTGGRTFSVKFEKKADIEAIRSELEKTFVENKEVASIELKTKSNDYNVEIMTNYKLKDDGATEEVKTKMSEALNRLKGKLGSHTFEGQRTVSASVSSELWNSSAISLTVALIAIFLYILFRFGYWQYSLGAIVGLIHDAFFVISVFSLLHGFLPFSLDVNQAFIAAILTVIGYSMNDTVIVFDRIRENLRASGPEDHHYEIVNRSLNTTLSRTFNTSMILFVVVLIMFIFGGPAIKGFLFALLVGVIIGTYSSLCVATPILIDFSKRLKA
ncbi:MAG: protein translocase subunit SecD [Flavobacteriia bacterium]|nr:protein translocase subunit SecD [Flavobacteriia bacterium]